MIGYPEIRKTASQMLEASAYGFPDCECKFSENMKCTSRPCECARRLADMARLFADRLDTFYKEQLGE